MSPDELTSLGDDDPWARYARTVVEVTGLGPDPLVLRPAGAGHCGAWPRPTPRPVHVLTAWDPGEERPPLHVNRARQASLEVDLRAMGADLWPAVGVDPVSGHREEGVAAAGLEEADALALGRRCRQDAVFAWTPGAWEIVACTGGRRIRLGWTLHPV
jgi:hypothetical protein